jgi:hypothetical protein
MGLERLRAISLVLLISKFAKYNLLIPLLVPPPSKAFKGGLLGLIDDKKSVLRLNFINGFTTAHAFK